VRRRFLELGRIR